MTEPKPRRGMPRSLLYAMIPLGFVLFVGALLLSGALRQEGVIESPVEEETVLPDE